MREYSREWDTDLASHTERNLWSKADEFLYLIMDPFNLTYNPAKNVIFCSSEYPKMFTEGLEQMTNTGSLTM